MYHVPVAIPEEKRLIRLPRRGCCVGMLTGMSAAILYAVILQGISAIIEPEEFTLFQALGFGVVQGAVLGIPAAILGGFSGCMIGIRLKQRITDNRKSIRKAALILSGIVIGVISCPFINLAIIAMKSDQSIALLVLLTVTLGMPGLIYSILLVVMSLRLYDWAHRSKN